LKKLSCFLIKGVTWAGLNSSGQAYPSAEQSIFEAATRLILASFKGSSSKVASFGAASSRAMPFGLASSAATSSRPKPSVLASSEAASFGVSSTAGARLFEAEPFAGLFEM